MESNTRQRICSLTCPGCPLRTARVQTQERALNVFRHAELSPELIGLSYTELDETGLVDESALVDAVRENTTVFAGRRNENNLARCARRILEDECDLYIADTSEALERLELSYEAEDRGQEDHLRYSPEY